MLSIITVPVPESEEITIARSLKGHLTQSQLENHVWELRHRAHYYVRILRACRGTWMVGCQREALEGLRICWIECRIAVRAMHI